MTEIIRPTFVVDKQICLRNIASMAQKARHFNVQFRPHFKTHQSATIGEWFRQMGVYSVTVSSVSMAEYFADHGWDDITIAFPVNILETAYIDRLASRISLNVIVDNQDSAEILATRITHHLGVYIEIDTGYPRTGIISSQTGQIDNVLDKISRNPKLVFKGFLSHSGHTYHARSTNEIHSRHFDALLKMKSLKSEYRHDFPYIGISLGDTPSCSICTNFEDVDEIRPGNFVFYDLKMQDLGVCSFEDIAVRLICPVVSRHLVRNEIVIYGGAVHLSRDFITNINGKKMYGRIVIRKGGQKILLDPLNYVADLTQEHGIIKLEQSQFGNFRIGDLVEIIPVHSCLTANLARNYLTTDGENIRTINS